jgi:hypothetical protein
MAKASHPHHKEKNLKSNDERFASVLVDYVENHNYEHA